MRMAKESPWMLQCAIGRTVRLTARNPSITCNVTASNLERSHRLILCSDYSKSVTKLPISVNALRYAQQTAPRNAPSNTAGQASPQVDDSARRIILVRHGNNNNARRLYSES